MEIKSLRQIYNTIPDQKPVENKLADINQELINKTINHLNKTPIFTPKVK